MLARSLWFCPNSYFSLTLSGLVEQTINWADRSKAKGIYDNDYHV